MPTGLRIKLSAMMFLQFMLIAVFWIQLAPYLTKVGGIKGWQMWLILSAMPIGCLFSPIFGMIADRYFSSNKVLFGMNLFGAITLFFAASQTNPTLLFVLLLLFMICYMPTWGLTSAIAMSNSPAEKFPQIRVFGSLGWFSSVAFSLLALQIWDVKIDGEIVGGDLVDGVIVGGMNVPMMCGAGISLLAAFIALLIPNTPPPAKGQPLSVVDALGLRSVTLMKDPKFAFFILVSFLVMIPFGMDWTYFGGYLDDQGFKTITWTTNLGRALEIIFMLFVPIAIMKMGVKWAMSVGLVAMCVRYGAYLASDVVNINIVYLGILVHGLIYGFFFVGGQIYINRKAPKEMQAQAQGFIFLVTFGLGLLVANFVNGYLIDLLKTDAKSWAAIWTFMTIFSGAALAVFFLLFWDKPGEVDETVKAEVAEKAETA